MPTVTKKSKKDKVLPLAVALSPDIKKESAEDKPIFYPPSEDGLRVSEETYWADYYEHPDFTYEWNNGILEEKGMSNIDTILLYDWFVELLTEYLKYHPVAKKFALELGGQIEIADKVSIRRPDLGIVLNSNPILPKGKDNSYQGTFDICIEAISKTKKKYEKNDTITKKREYALGGVKEYYILDGDGTKTAFYRLNKQGNYEEIKSKDGIIRSEVLPGFQFRISDLYERPPINELRHDDIYKHFVALGWQKSDEKTRTEILARQQAERKAETEAKARQQAERKAEAEAKSRQQAERKAEAEAKARQEEAKARQQAEAEIERLKALLNKQNNKQ